jgi:DNA-binding GntR family transcriptional regulator
VAPDFSGQIGRVSAPLREQVLSVLREAILSFQLRPGQRLIERELIDSTGVSRTTIREVLRELAAEGLVKTIPQKGAVVVTPSAEDAVDLYDIGAVLEAHLAERFVQHASPAQAASLRRAFEQLEQTVERDAGAVAILKAEDKLYDVLAKGAGNNALQVMVAQLHARVSLLRATSLTADPARPRQSVAELRALVDAIERRDASATREASLEHVRNAAEAGVRGLRATAGNPLSLPD